MYAYFLRGVCRNVDNIPATSIAQLQTVHVSAAWPELAKGLIHSFM